MPRQNVICMPGLNGMKLNFGESGCFDVAGLAIVHHDVEVVISAVAANFDNSAVAGRRDAGTDISPIAITGDHNSVAHAESQDSAHLVTHRHSARSSNKKTVRVDSPFQHSLSSLMYISLALAECFNYIIPFIFCQGVLAYFG